MTLDELIAWARDWAKGTTTHNRDRKGMAAIIKLLDGPSGYESPHPWTDDGIVHADSFGGSPNEARAYATDIMRTADKAEEAL